MLAIRLLQMYNKKRNFKKQVCNPNFTMQTKDKHLTVYRIESALIVRCQEVE